MTSYYPKGSKVRFVAGYPRERAREWWQEVGYALGAPTIEAITWLDYLTQYRMEFAPIVEVEQLAMEFLGMWRSLPSSERVLYWYDSTMQTRR